MGEQKIYIVGIGDDGWQGLTARAQQVLEQADVIVGMDQALRWVEHLPAEKIDASGHLESLVDRLQALCDQRVVVVASGDPLFYGVTRYVCQRLGHDRFEVIPHVSSMQLAFARVKESWDDAYLANVASQDPDRLIERIRGADKVGLFTSEELPPSKVAELLLASHIDYFDAYVCENLGSPDERVTQGELKDLVGQSFSPLNVLILIRKPRRLSNKGAQRPRRLFGNPDDMFLESLPKRGLLTPAEVRAVALSEMEIAPGDTVWDVGAGSGSVAIEVALLNPTGRVFAIEMDPQDHQLIRENAERFGVANLVPVLGEAPAAWHELPDPDAVFVGGSGRQVAALVAEAFQRLRPGGRLVATVSSLDNVAAVRDVLERQAGEVGLLLVQISRGLYQMERIALAALNPVFILRARKAM
ncbi:MAG: precorrin-6Y-methylase [Pirellulaceae bacterium]|nr:MAG: precorrin-6Y-methylase [Pirellulaceae bacterium]